MGAKNGLFYFSAFGFDLVKSTRSAIGQGHS